MSTPTDSQPDLKVWDPLVRILHWSLAASTIVAWLSAGVLHLKLVHFWAGYAAAVIVVIRLLWGILGPRRARFTDFVRAPTVVLRYLADIGRGSERRFIGHNPAGGAMVVALLGVVGMQTLTGWLGTTDMFFGVEWLEELHEVTSKLILMLVPLHILGVAVASWRHRENLPLAMMTGRKRAPRGDDVG